MKNKFLSITTDIDFLLHTIDYSKIIQRFSSLFCVIIIVLIINCSPRATEHKESNENDPDAIQFVYDEFDKKVHDGTLVIKKPWEKMGRPTISYGLVDNTATYEFLSQVTSNLWIATDKICGAPKCKQVEEDMYRCEACWEYYHLKCISDHREAPTSEEMYLCPLHIHNKSKIMASVGKRRIPPPLRLRKSLS